MLSFIAERKVLLVTGYPRNLGNQLEIVDSFGQAKKCTSIQKFPRKPQMAMGGVLSENVVICGGTTTGGPSGATNQCHTLKDNGQWAPLGAGLEGIRYRGAAAAVNIKGEEFLWITGKEFCTTFCFVFTLGLLALSLSCQTLRT